MTRGIDKEAEVLLIKAAEDASAAQLPLPDGPFGFHAQQAVEKLLKALLCQLAVKYKFTHDLDYLVRLLESHGEGIPKGPVDFTDLDRYGVAYRYNAVPEVEILDRAPVIEGIRILREHVTARIAALSSTP